MFISLYYQNKKIQLPPFIHLKLRFITSVNIVLFEFHSQTSKSN